MRPRLVRVVPRTLTLGALVFILFFPVFGPPALEDVIGSSRAARVDHQHPQPDHRKPPPP